MDEEFDRAISAVVARFRPNMQPIEAMQFSQAVYNLANAKACLIGCVDEARPKRGRPPKVAADEA